MKKTELRKLIKQMISEQLGGMPQGGMPQGGMPQGGGMSQGRKPQGRGQGMENQEMFIDLENHPQAGKIKQMMQGKGPGGGTSKKPHIQFTLRPFGLKIRFTAPWHW